MILFIQNLAIRHIHEIYIIIHMSESCNILLLHYINQDYLVIFCYYFESLHNVY